MGKSGQQDSVNLFLNLLSVEPSPWKEKINRLMKEKMIHTKKGVRERTVGDRAFIRRRDALNTIHHCLSDSSKRNCHDFNIKATTHQSFHIPSLLHLPATWRDTFISFPERVSAQGKVSSSQKQAAGQETDSTGLWDVNEVRSWTGPPTMYYTAAVLPLLFVLLRNTNDILHYLFLDTPL